MALKVDRNFHFKFLLYTALLSCASWTVCLAVSDVDPCKFFPNNVKIRDPADCSQGITCINFQSTYTTKCSGSTPFYDKDKDVCVKSLTDPSSCFISCANSAGKFVADPKTCYGYYYCEDETWARYGLCPDTTHFQESTQACVYSSESNCTIGSLDFCAIVKNNVNFNDESNCAKYYYCKSGELTSASCKNGNYYDPSSGECIRKSLVQCFNHPYPSNVCGTQKNPKVGFVADGATCRGAFYCAKVEGGPDPAPTWSQCPPNTFYNGNKEGVICSNPLEVKCSEDRCEGRQLPFVSSGRAGCRHYLRCSNGATMDEMSCGNKFFDEEAGVCTSAIIQYPSCS